MNILGVYKENSNDEIYGKLMGKFSSGLICASYIASLPNEDLHMYRVALWFVGDEGNFPEDDWEFIEDARADEWLEDFVSNGRLSGKEPDEYLLSVGARVFLSTGNYTKRQKRFCVIDAIKPEKGREYAILRGITNRGVSKSNSQVVYMKFSQLETLEVLGRFLQYKPLSKTTS